MQIILIVTTVELLRVLQCYFSFEIHFSFSFYKFFHQSFLFLYYIRLSVFHEQSFQFYAVWPTLFI